MPCKSKGKKPPRKDSCPSCNGMKDVRAIECNKCRFQNRHPRTGTGKYGIGRSIMAGGYIMLTDTREYEHRVVVENKLGRKLDKNEHVHHKNGDKTDNRIENLEVMNKSDHHREHMPSNIAKERSIMGLKARWGYDASSL